MYKRELVSWLEFGPLRDVLIFKRDVGLAKSELTSINTRKAIWVFVDNQFLEISECLLLVNDNPETWLSPSP